MTTQPRYDVWDFMPDNPKLPLGPDMLGPPRPPAETKDKPKEERNIALLEDLFAGAAWAGDKMYWGFDLAMDNLNPLLMDYKGKTVLQWSAIGPIELVEFMGETAFSGWREDAIQGFTEGLRLYADSDRFNDDWKKVYISAHLLVAAGKIPKLGGALKGSTPFVGAGTAYAAGRLGKDGIQGTFEDVLDTFDMFKDKSGSELEDQLNNIMDEEVKQEELLTDTEQARETVKAMADVHPLFAMYGRGYYRERRRWLRGQYRQTAATGS